ncbi:MAG: PAS domain S-box protein [Candidatus Kariarchaeaceae archaeon]|jgi:PAS domain S-box-containing protein
MNTVLNDIPFDIVYIDKEGTIQLANENFRKMHNKVSIGGNIFDCVHPNLQSELRKNINQTVETGIETSYELQIAGSWYRARILPEKKDEITLGCIILMYDYEAKKQAEFSHMQTLHNYETLFSSAPIGIYTTRDLAILMANQEFVDIFGYDSVDEVIGKNLLDLFPEDVRPMIQERSLRRFELKPEPTSYETIGLKKDEKRFDMHINVDLIDLPEGPTKIGFVEDISERKNAEKILKESEEKYRLVTESAFAAIFIRCIEPGEEAIVEANESCLKMWGYNSLDEIRDKTPYDLTIPESAELIQEKIHERIIEPYEFTGIRKDGSHFFGESIAKNFIYNGKKARIVAVRDITDKKLAEEDLRQTREHLYQSQKIEAVGRFAGGIAHDFNNMLGIIQSHCDLLLAQLQRSNPIYNDIQNIQTATQNAASLTSQLLKFSKKQDLKPEKINLNITVRAMSGMIERIIPKNIELLLELEDYLRIVFVDPSQIGQVMMNLILNAIDAMPNGGQLKISTKNMKKHPYVKLSIQDTGIGMDEYTRKHLFEPFYTTKKEKGTGLGLATTYRIIQESSGRIEVDSALNKGTTFKIYLPYIDKN